MTRPRIMKAGPYRWLVTVPVAKDILGRIKFETVSEHRTKAQALKALEGVAHLAKDFYTPTQFDFGAPHCAL